MSLGDLQTNKSWGELLKEVKLELQRWGITDYELPFKDDSVRRQEVTIRIRRNGATFPVTCGNWVGPNGPECNLCAIREVIRSLRLADQRGIGLVMAQAAKDLLMLPEGRKPDDPNYILGVRPEMPVAVKKAAYRELVKLYHPDVVGTGDRAKFEAVRQAAEKLGLT